MSVPQPQVRNPQPRSLSTGKFRLISTSRLVHLDVEDSSEDLLRQLSYAIKNQLKALKIPLLHWGLLLVLYGIWAPCAYNISFPGTKVDLSYEKQTHDGGILHALSRFFMA